MGTMIQIRNVPYALHRQLKSRAALPGMSLSDYLLGEIREIVGRPTLGRCERACGAGRKRCSEVRNNVTAYDAVYVVLAEAQDAPLLTRDRHLAAAGGHRGRIELV